MPDPKTVAQISVNGTKYAGWETVEVSRSFDDKTITYFKFTATESDGYTSWGALKIKPGDQCQIILGGKTAIQKGLIEVRQASYTDKAHGLLLAGLALTGDVAAASVDAQSGQYKNTSYEQICRSVLQPFGVKFRVDNAPDGNGQFKLVNVQFGETAWALIERLTRMVNLHLREESDGTLVAFSGTRGSAGDLVEGGNILSGYCEIDYSGLFNRTVAVGQAPGSDDSFGEKSRNAEAVQTNPLMQRYRPNKFLSEEPGDQEAMKRRVQREVDEQIGTSTVVRVTVPGWFNGAELWLDQIGKTVTVDSPMLFPGPNGRMNLAIKAVSSTQGGEGTISSIELCLPQWLGAARPTDASGDQGSPFGATPAPVSYET
ncbi:hypothetical protein MKK75_02820 [Methylobacterium sp. J-030]|uniref:phage baseplate assembly protein n=1 Tax=Methylobacterium sp. J-030 TaxID=2836627 RepID=UPI001FB9EEE9|nr:hypothetical protein [Methylobacterium sp. J-030]MCJ2067747.1 hypothetical protein [Methylobacterium sp. J-030]